MSNAALDELAAFSHSFDTTSFPSLFDPALYLILLRMLGDDPGLTMLC